MVLPDGVVLNYYDGGQGEKTLVVLNAYGQSFGYWERFLRAVSNRFHIILWLPRANDADTIGLKVVVPQAVHAEDLERVLSQESVECCTLLAWCSEPELALSIIRATHTEFPRCCLWLHRSKVCGSTEPWKLNTKGTWSRCWKRSGYGDG